MIVNNTPVTAVPEKESLSEAVARKKRSGLSILKFIVKTGSMGERNTSFLGSAVKRRRGFKPDFDPAVRRYTDTVPVAGEILLKSPLDRTADEKKTLFKHLREFKAFRKLSDFTLSEVVGSLILQEFEPDRAIFKQGRISNLAYLRKIGDVGTAWYIILSGTVSVQISRTGKIEDSVKVARLRDG